MLFGIESLVCMDILFEAAGLTQRLQKLVWGDVHGDFDRSMLVTRQEKLCVAFAPFSDLDRCMHVHL